MTTSHVVSGATGFLGRRLVRALLARGDHVVALVRGRDAAEAGARLRAVQRHAPVDSHSGARPPSALSTPSCEAGRAPPSGFPEGPAGRLDVVACDVAERLPIAAIAALGPFDQVWHLAAHLDLGERRTDHMLRVNVGGTGHMLELAAALGDVRFQHVGTAYSCGITNAPVPEAAPRGPVVPRNSYERSKHEAEGIVRQAMERGLRATIHRPSIVVGDSRDGATEVYGPFYLFLRVCHLARRYGPLTLPARSDTTLDLVPVDRVTAALVALGDHPDAEGLTFHLTHPRPPRLADVARVANAVLGLRVDGLRNVDPDLLPFASNAILRAAAPVLPYLRQAPRFQHATVDRLLGADFLAPQVPEPVWLRRLMRHAEQHGFGVDARTLSREARVLARLVSVAASRTDVAV